MTRLVVQASCLSTHSFIRGCFTEVINLKVVNVEHEDDDVLADVMYISG
jgi:hypothetical protein